MNSLTPYDAYQLMNELVQQATGQKDISVADTSSFVTVGETLLRVGIENTLNALSNVIGRTIFSIRPYRSRLGSLERDPVRYGNIVRKITYLSKGADPTTDWNTQLAPNQLADGQSVDMYKINAPKAVQLNFPGTKTLEKYITRFRNQIYPAVRSESEFLRFMDGVMVAFWNDVELLNEAEKRAVLLNYMAGISSMGITEVDLIAEYNTEFGTSYTRAQLLTTHLTEFMQYMAAQIKIWSRKMEDMSSKYHAQLTGYGQILRHTPRSRQRMLMYEPLFLTAQSRVYSGLFNPKYLEIGDYEGVNYWQDQNDPMEINVLPNILDVATGSSKTAESSVELPYVLGLLYDEEALGVMPQYDYASTTPYNSAGGYYNMFLHWNFNTYNDFTENAILFVLGNGA